MKYKITLKDIGRSKFNDSFEWSCSTLAIAEKKALEECSKHLMSSDFGLDICSESKNKHLFNLFAGFHKVGKVIIEELKK